MLKILYARLKQKFRTFPFPKKEPSLPPLFRGLPKIDQNKATDQDFNKECPTGAILQDKKISIDLGKCLFCLDCPLKKSGAMSYTQDYRLSTRKREELIISDELTLAKGLEGKIKKMLGRSLRLRQVSAGGCNGCEVDVNVLNTPVFDLSRFGVQFVASPRHADGLLITGALSKNMELAVKKTYDAIAFPKIVIAVGACAISGGPYIDHPEVLNGADKVLPVDLLVAGCPPHPYTILDGILRLLERRYPKGS